MTRIDSVRFSREASQCEVAAKIAEFLESSAPAGSYDFALPDLLYFSDEKVFLELRENATWQALEGEYKAGGGMISEDWDDEEEYTEIAEKPVKVLRQDNPNSRLVGLAVLILVSAIIGGVAGYMFPQNFHFPNLSEVKK